MIWSLLLVTLKGIFGSALGKWFLSTRLGMWFQTRLDNCMEFLAVRYHINIVRKEEKWRSDYPLLAKRIDDLEADFNKLKKRNGL